MLAATLGLVVNRVSNPYRMKATNMSLSEFPQVVNGDQPDFSTASEIGHNGGPPLVDDGSFPKRGGFVVVTREMRDHHIVGFGSAGFYSKSEAWIDLIMECKYKAGVVNNGGRPMLIKPGQLVGAVSWLASRWNWTPKEVRYFLDRLENEGMIERFTPGAEAESASSSVEQSLIVRGKNRGKQKGKQSTVISICNYEIYQFLSRAARQAKGQATGEQGASKGQARGNNYNKETKEQGNNIEIASQNVADATENLAGQDLASQMAEDVASWMHGGDDKLARTWLRNASTSYGSGNLRDAWMKLKTDLAEGRIVANKLATLSAIAKRIKETPPVAKLSEPQKPKIPAHMRRY